MPDETQPPANAGSMQETGRHVTGGEFRCPLKPTLPGIIAGRVVIAVSRRHAG